MVKGNYMTLEAGIQLLLLLTRCSQQVQAGCFRTSLPAAGIHLREKNIAGPTERSEYAYAYSKLVGQELRFSMKMMPAPDIVLGSLPGLIPMQLARVFRLLFKPAKELYHKNGDMSPNVI